MGFIEVLVRQSGKPSGILGRIMVKIMNHVDSGLNNWILNKINDPKGLALVSVAVVEKPFYLKTESQYNVW
jgi:hypothetical protein